MILHLCQLRGRHMDDIEMRLVEHRLGVRGLSDAVCDVLPESAGPGDAQLLVDGTRSTPGLVWEVVLDEVETSRVNDRCLLIRSLIKDSVRLHVHRDLLRARAGPSGPRANTEQDQQDHNSDPDQTRGAKARVKATRLNLNHVEKFLLDPDRLYLMVNFEIDQGSLLCFDGLSRAECALGHKCMVIEIETVYSTNRVAAPGRPLLTLLMLRDTDIRRCGVHGHAATTVTRGRVAGFCMEWPC
mmetsp:Transcript_28336/g.75736  ORF Transcript_28336/g.75736 Transcript_28336/m.75736 type:complete len:242 (+) Transcript_28336:714-1439(+)